MTFSSWKKDLEQLLPVLRRVALGSARVSVYALNDRVVLGLAKHGDLARAVIRLYRPMRFHARVVVGGLSLLTRFGLHRLIERSDGSVAKAEVSWLADAQEVGFLGCNPSHGLRCVLLSRSGGGRMTVTKLAVGENSETLTAEVECLEGLTGYAGVPQVLAKQSGPDWVAFQMEHFDGSGPFSVVDGNVIQLLEGWL